MTVRTDIFLYTEKLSYVNSPLGKPHRKNHPRHLGIALLAIAPPPPHSNGHSGALHLGKKCPKPSGQGSRPPQNEGNSSKKSCPKPSGQGVCPPPPNGQCPNAWGDFLNGASLMQVVPCIAKFNPSHGVNFWVRCASGNV